MSAYVRTTTVDSAPSGDSVKQAILDLDTDLTGHVAAYNAHDTATTSVHGFTGTKTGSGAMVGATSPTLVTPVFTGTITNATGAIATITGTISETENATHYHYGHDILMANYALDAGITNSGGLYGIRASAYIGTETFCGTLAKQIGIHGRAGISSCGVGGTINAAYGGYFDIVNNDADGTITTAYGVYVHNAGVTGTMTNRFGLGITAMAGAGTLAAGINIGALSGTQTNKHGIILGEISGASTNNYGISIGNVSGGTNNYAIYTGTGDVRFGGLVNTTAHYEVDGTQVVSNRVVDARCDDTINTSAWDSTTAGVLDSLRDAMITHGLIAAS